MDSIQQNTRVGPRRYKQPFLSGNSTGKRLNPVELAILKTSAYADIFDYPLDAQEMYFYLIGIKASFETVASTLKDSQAIREHIEEGESYFTLKGRGAIIETRRRRSKVSERLMPKAVLYGSWIARFPFARMVALTGALAVGNVAEGADIDFLIVTENGRVWTCRALLLLLVRMAALCGDRICPNYYLSERSLSFSGPDLYTAHEVAQMIPIAGMETYWRMRELNAWTLEFLPNAAGLNPRYASFLKESSLRVGDGPFERFFRRPFFQGFERWEMERKVRKFHRKFPPSQGKAQDEAAFSPEWCKGHFDGHRQRTLVAYRERIRRLNDE